LQLVISGTVREENWGLQRQAVKKKDITTAEKEV